MKDYLKQAKAINEEVIGFRRHLHQNPEIGHELPTTTQYVVERLKEFGMEPEVITDSAISVLIGNPDGKTILLRADMDALQITEDVDIDFISKNEGHMHACGHDMHTAMLLGAAKILKENEKDLKGQVKFMFQPAEESFTGAVAMIEAGILENPKPDVAVGLHVFPGMYNEKPGLVGVQDGPIMAGSQNYRLDITGKGGHAATPELSIDPITIGMHIVNQINTIKMREVPATEPLVITFGQFKFGETFNVIPNSGVIQGTFRFFNAEVGAYVLKRIEEIVKETTKLFGGKVTMTTLGHAPPNINNENLAQEATGYLTESLGEEYVKSLNLQAMGSEDFAFVSEKMDSLFIPIVAGAPQDGYSTAVHNPNTKFDEGVLPYGVATLVTMATEWLENH